MGAAMDRVLSLAKLFTLAVTSVLTSLLTGKAQMLQEYTMPPPKEQMTKIKLIFTFMIVDFHLRDIDMQ